MKNIAPLVMLCLAFTGIVFFGAEFFIYDVRIIHKNKKALV